jgi:hypothetical protein
MNRKAPVKLLRTARFAPVGCGSRRRCAFRRTPVAWARVRRHSPAHRIIFCWRNAVLLQIILHTPKWVFAVFVLLVWLGCKQLLSGSVSLAKVTVMPIAMTGLSVAGVVSAFGDSPGALLGWAVAAGALVLVVLQSPLPASTSYDRAAREFHVAGSAVPLVLMMGIFFTKYVVGVALAMHPELRQQASFAVAIPMLYGAFSGIFAARAVRLWKLAIRADAVAVAARAA